MMKRPDTRRRTAGAIAATVLSVGIVAAQNAPSLSGTWVLDPEKTAAVSPRGAGVGAGGGVGAVGGGGGMRADGPPSGGGGGMLRGAAPPQWTIEQTAATLTITRALPDGAAQKFVHKLDGSESVNVNGRTTLTSRTSVSGGRFVTTGTQVVKTEQGDVTSSVTEVRWLEKDGSMVVEMTRTVDGASRTAMSILVRKTT